MKFTKAIVAFVMSSITIVNQIFGFGIEVDPDIINAVLVGLTPLLVFLLPNRG